jgi:hypothetical protein
VATLLGDHEADLELWIRPERAGSGYAVEWTTLDDAADDRDLHPQNGRGEATGPSVRAVGERAWQLLTSHVARLRARMPTFDVDREEINIFKIDDTYLFKHYFEQEDLFQALRPYYNEDDYRFKVPREAFNEVQELLRDHFYEPTVVDDPEPFCVVHPKYSKHADVLFKASVLQRSHGDHHVFLMKDQVSVEQAVNRGAELLAEKDLEFSF